MVDFEVTEGNRYELDYLLENRGQASKTEDVELRVDGQLTDSDASITLDPGNTTTGTLETDAFGEDDVDQTYNIELIADNKRTRLIEVVADILDGPLAIAGEDADGDRRDTVYRFDDGWETIDPLPEVRSDLAATQDAEGRPLAIGGRDAGGDISDTVYRFDDGWETIDPLPEVRDRLAAT